MKIKLLMACLLGLISATVLAQNKELEKAQESYKDYQVSSSDKTHIALLATKATASLNDAKTSIDKAAANPKTSALPLTFAVKGAVYSALALRDTVPATSAVLFTTADEAIKKAKELDPKGENKKLIEEANLNLAQSKLNEGVKEYQGAKYDQAYKAFDYYRQVLPEDTTAVFYTGLSASMASRTDAKFYPLAIDNYNRLVNLKYSQNFKVYLDLSGLYLANKDTAGAMKSIADGVTKFPSDNALRKREIEISLTAGKISDIQGKIQSAITNDPKNKTLYYYNALTYSQLADAADAGSEKTKDAAAKKSLHQTALENYEKAAGMYKKALEIDPDYFEANLNLGYVLIKPAIDAYNAANKLPADKQKEYDAAIAKANVQFDLARPYLQKAVDLKPTADALTNLRNYYRGRNDKVHQKENDAKAAELKKQIDALPPAQ